MALICSWWHSNLKQDRWMEGMAAFHLAYILGDYGMVTRVLVARGSGWGHSIYHVPYGIRGKYAVVGESFSRIGIRSNNVAPWILLVECCDIRRILIVVPS